MPVMQPVHELNAQKQLKNKGTIDGASWACKMVSISHYLTKT